MSIPYEKSFASQKKSKFWSKKNEKQPSECRKSSHSKYLFDCEKCGHEFENSLGHITNSNRWCSFCANQKLCDNEDCEMCFEKSFASHEKHIFWSVTNDKIPREVFKSDNKKYIFDCEKCFHEFESSLNNINNSKWCGFCSNPPKHLCDDEDCKLCKSKSFSSHPKAIFWSSKNDKKSREVFKSSGSKYLFVCEKGHEFQSSLNDITYHNSWCPLCVNKTETKLYERMIPLFPSMITQFKQDWCKNENNNYLPFDFCIPERIIIELDGPQHFIQVSNWTPPEITFENDKYKEKCANENGYSTIRIVQDDVWNDKYDWCKELCETIENIKNGNKIVNIYLCKNNEYDKYL
jgi:hypothetical protein